MKRRAFITLLGGAVVTWPLAARAQEAERVRRIGVLVASGSADDPDIKERYAAFLQRLQQLGWIEGRNVRIDTRWPQAIPTAFASTRRNWPRSRPMSSWPVARRS